MIYYYNLGNIEFSYDIYLYFYNLGYYNDVIYYFVNFWQIDEIFL